MKRNQLINKRIRSTGRNKGVNRRECVRNDVSGAEVHKTGSKGGVREEPREAPERGPRNAAPLTC